MYEQLTQLHDLGGCGESQRKKDVRPSPFPILENPGKSSLSQTKASARNGRAWGEVESNVKVEVGIVRIYPHRLRQKPSDRRKHHLSG